MSIRGVFGTDGTKNAVHGSDYVESARRELNFFFNPKTMPSSGVINNCSLCLVKPHIIKDGLAG